MPRLRPRAVLSAQDLPTTRAMVPAPGGEVTMADEAETAAAATATDPGENNFIGRLATYIPAEIIAAYHTILGVIPDPRANATAIGIIGIILLILTPAWIYFGTKNTGERPAWHQVVNSTLAFAVWLVVTNEPFIKDHISTWQPYYGSAAMVILVALLFPLIERITKPAA